MDHRQRFLAHFDGEVPDRTPVFLRDFTLGLDILGVRTTDLFSNSYDPRLASRSVVSFGRQTGQDAIVGCVHSPAFIVENFGGRMKYPEWGIPSVIEHPISSPGTLDDINTTIKGKALEAVESYHISRKDCPDLAIVGNITGPLTKASVLMGMDMLSIALEQDPDFVTDVIETAIEATETFTEMIMDDIDAVFIASASDNPDLFGSEKICSVTAPYLKDMVKWIHHRGRPVIFHPHGDFCSKGLMDAVLDTGIDCFQFAEANDPSKICEHIGDRCAVMGGTDIVPTLYSGNKEEIIAESDRYILACSGNRYIFSCSCSLQRGTPIDGIKIMCEYIGMK